MKISTKRKVGAILGRLAISHAVIQYAFKIIMNQNDLTKVMNYAGRISVLAEAATYETYWQEKTEAGIFSEYIIFENILTGGEYPQSLSYEPNSFYLQNLDAGYLGNSPVWYAQNSKGYTAYPLNAHRFREKEANEEIASCVGKYRKYECQKIDKHLQLIFDSQSISRLDQDPFSIIKKEVVA